MDVKTQSPRAAAHPGPSSRMDSGRTGRNEALDFAASMLKLLLAVLIVRSFVFAPFAIPSESMLPRLWNGDVLLAAKWPYGFSRSSLPFDAPLIDGRLFAREPKRGDVVIFKHPIDHTDYVKRVIALPGDTIALTQGRVVLNGAFVPRARLTDFAIPRSPNTACAWGAIEARGPDGAPVCRYTRYRETLPGGRSYDVLDFGPTPGDVLAPVTIPAGHMFVLGDNRDNSRDSRFEARTGDAVGIVPQDNLVGRANVIMWSSDGSARWTQPWTWFTATRSQRIGAAL